MRAIAGMAIGGMAALTLLSTDCTHTVTGYCLSEEEGPRSGTWFDQHTGYIKELVESHQQRHAQSTGSISAAEIQWEHDGDERS